MVPQTNSSRSKQHYGEVAPVLVLSSAYGAVPLADTPGVERATEHTRYQEIAVSTGEHTSAADMKMSFLGDIHRVVTCCVCPLK